MCYFDNPAPVIIHIVTYEYDKIILNLYKSWRLVNFAEMYC